MYFETDGNDELGDGQDPQSPPELREPWSQTKNIREETPGVFDTGGNLWAKRSVAEDGAAVNLGTRGATAGALLASREPSTPAEEHRRGEMRSCTIASTMAPDHGAIATGWSATSPE